VWRRFGARVPMLVGANSESRMIAERQLRGSYKSGSNNDLCHKVGGGDS
jgi:hypothetical protein